MGLYKWDAAPRTEHAVLAAGEALEVRSAAHFCCVSWLFCLLIAPLRAVWPASQAVCSVHSVWTIAADAVFCSSSSDEALIDAHNDLASGVSVCSCEVAKKRARDQGMTRATPHAMPSNSTALFPKDATRRNPSLTNRALQRASVRRALESDF